MPLDAYPARLQTVEHAVARIRNSLQGHGNEFAECFPWKPRDRHPSGTLFSDPDGGSVREIEEEYGRVSYTPTAMGVKVNVTGQAPVAAKLRVRMGLYYPVRPTHAEAQAWLRDFAGEADKLRLPVKYRRVPIDAAMDAKFPLDGNGQFDLEPEATRQLQAHLDRAAVEGMRDPDLMFLGAKGGGGPTVECQRSDIEDPQAYQALFDQGKPAELRWEGQVHYRVVNEGPATFLEVLVHNASPRIASRCEEAFVGVVFSLEAGTDRLAKFQLRELETRDYRYDATTWTVGRNAYAAGTRNNGRVTVETDSVPLHTQKRLAPQEWKVDGKPIDLRFDTLARDPAPTLKAAQSAMQDYALQWNAKAAAVDGAQAQAAQVKAGLADFERERQRFEKGVEALADPDVMTAFRLANRAFADRFRRIDATGGSWRLFQLVFIVTEIADMVDRHHGRHGAKGPAPTVLWFPTGGGKTEAYLGLVVWHAFWDRLRGKPFGVTAFAKFPLRMLSLQQFSRVVAVMEHAEDIRGAAPELDGRRGDPFSVGYYAGGGNSENLIDWPVSPDGSKRTEIGNFLKNKLRRADQRAALESLHRKVARCPMCNGNVKTTFVDAKPGFEHKCEACSRVLNLHLTDTEVLRRLPTLVIATVDKLARFAAEHWGRSLFGEAAWHCPDHGYLIAKPDDGRCPVLTCTKALNAAPANVDPVPSILVQDELHVMEESLGAMASHYETMLMDTMRRKPGKGPWKIVGCTATIEGYQYLVRQLYNHHSSARFPVAGPSAAESFYTRRTDEVQRLVLGVRTHGMSHVDATMRVFLEYHRAMAPVFDPARCKPGLLPQHLNGVSAADLKALGRWYRTAIGYGINKNEVSQVARSFAGQLTAYCKREGLSEFEDGRVNLLTGDTPMESLQRWLEAAEAGAEPYCQAASVTNLFALGVDIKWLNFLVFRGMPHGMAEYIQAMSRVGRFEGVPAIVVNVYNPNRERDASHFEAHDKFLEFAPVLIRHVPTTRFSKQALDLTYPGLFMHQINFHTPIKEIWKRQSVLGAGVELRDNEPRYRDSLLAALGVSDAPDADSSLVQRQKVHAEHLLSAIRTELQKKTPGVNPMQESAKERLKVPNSLRTTDETIRIVSNGRVDGGA